MPLTPDDDAVLRMLAGANFGPGAKLVLPSGQRMEGDEAQVLTSAYAPARTDRLDRPDRHRADRWRRTALLESCRPATAADYAAWLAGYLRRGGRVTHPYDYNLPGDWVVLERPASVPSLYGADALHVIVPAEVRFTPTHVPRTFHGCCGHSGFYFMDGFAAVSLIVPSYRDVEAALRSEG